MSKILLIIGNGFDLRCGLKTSYNDFFNYLLKYDINFKNAYNCVEYAYNKNFIKNLIPIDEKWINQIGSINNIWELYFICKYFESEKNIGQKNWSDIEKEISFIIRNPNKDFENSFFRLFQDANSCSIERKSFMDNISYSLFEKIIITYMLYRRTNNTLCQFKTEINLNKWLLQELNNFENVFCAFIEY